MLWMTQTHILSNHLIIVDVMYDSNQSDFTHTEGLCPCYHLSRRIRHETCLWVAMRRQQTREKKKSHSAVNVKERCEPAPSPLLHLKDT